jgi:YfiH family protein
MEQAHGAVVAVADAATPDDVAGVDALVTAAPGVPIAVLVADCVPLVLSGDHAVAVVHAGRRGVEKGVVAAAVAALRNLDDGPLSAFVGPSVCGRCYEVPAEMQASVSSVVPEALSTTRAGTPGLDLAAAVCAQLRQAGVEARVSRVCTREDPTYFSYRRDGVTGRFAAAVMLEA